MVTNFAVDDVDLHTSFNGQSRNLKFIDLTWDGSAYPLIPQKKRKKNKIMALSVLQFMTKNSLIWGWNLCIYLWLKLEILVERYQRGNQKDRQANDQKGEQWSSRNYRLNNTNTSHWSIEHFPHLNNSAIRTNVMYVLFVQLKFWIPVLNSVCLTILDKISRKGLYEHTKQIYPSLSYVLAEKLITWVKQKSLIHSLKVLSYEKVYCSPLSIAHLSKATITYSLTQCMISWNKYLVFDEILLTFR